LALDSHCDPDGQWSASLFSRSWWASFLPDI
jgi:hypothetical protein